MPGVRSGRQDDDAPLTGVGLAPRQDLVGTKHLLLFVVRLILQAPTLLNLPFPAAGLGAFT